MIGYRGALRYMREPDLLRLELDAIAPRLTTPGHPNLHVMLPFVRTARELERLPRTWSRESRAARRAAASSCGSWPRSRPCCSTSSATPSSAIAGISIGSNDLTQLLLGADRDSEVLAEVFDERDPAVVRLPAAADPARRARSACRRRSAARRHPCTPSTRSCSSAPASTRSRSTSTPSTARGGSIAAAEQRLLLDVAR